MNYWLYLFILISISSYIICIIAYLIYLYEEVDNKKDFKIMILISPIVPFFIPLVPFSMFYKKYKSLREE